MTLKLIMNGLKNKQLWCAFVIIFLTAIALTNIYHDKKIDEIKLRYLRHLEKDIVIKQHLIGKRAGEPGEILFNKKDKKPGWKTLRLYIGRFHCPSCLETVFDYIGKDIEKDYNIELLYYSNSKTDIGYDVKKYSIVCPVYTIDDTAFYKDNGFLDDTAAMLLDEEGVIMDIALFGRIKGGVDPGEVMFKAIVHR